MSEVTFYSDEDPSKTFVISNKSAETSALLSSVLGSSADLKNIQLPKIKHAGGDGRTYFINTTKLLSYVHEYLKMWESDVEGSNYVKEKPIQTGDIRQVLQQIDIDFINRYLLSELPEEAKPLYHSNVKYKRQMDIDIIGVLLSQCDEFLGITSISNKLYAYIAVQIWNTTIADFHSATKDPLFAKMQQEAVNEWKEQHVARLSSRVVSTTTGDADDNDDLIHVKI